MDVLSADGTKYGDAPRCEACGKFIGLRCWLPPYKVELETWGYQFGDIAFPSGGEELLVSLRFKKLWECQGLVGLNNFAPVETVEVRRHRKLIGEPPPYFKATVILSQAIVDYVASGVDMEESPTCPVCRLGSGVKRWKAVIIEPSTWSGEDIFRPRWAGAFLVTKRFKSFCEANEIKNTVFIPAEEYSHDFYPWEKKF
jgi:hypothetical protein